MGSGLEALPWTLEDMEGVASVKLWVGTQVLCSWWVVRRAWKKHCKPWVEEKETFQAFLQVLNLAPKNTMSISAC